MSKQLIAAALAAAAMFAASHTLYAQTLTSSQLNERTIERRAVEAGFWGMSLVNYERMAQALVATRRVRSTRSSTGRGPPTGRTRR